MKPTPLEIRGPSLVLILALVLLTTPALRAQESKAYFDATVVSFPSQSAVHSLADLDGDGVVDTLGWWRLYGGDPDVEVQAFRGQGDGTFEPFWTITRPSIYQSTFANTDWAMAVGSFDANARDDFVIALDSLVEAYTSNAAGFPVLYWRRPVSDTSVVSSAVVADFDGDGLDDLALALEPDGIQVYMNTGTSLVPTSTSSFGRSIAAADVDGAVGLDLVARKLSQVRLLSVTAGLIAVHAEFTVPVLGSLHEVAGDIDGDGDDDVVVFAESSETYVVLRQTTRGSFVMEGIADGGPASDFVDIDGDGDLDGVCCGGGGGCPCPLGNNMTSTFRISINDGSGSFAPGWSVRGHGAIRLAGAEDVDGDGDVDLVAGRGVYFNRGFNFGGPQPYVALSSNYYLLSRFGDLDEDGDLDSYTTLGTQGVLNDGSGGTPTVASPVRPALPAGGQWDNPSYIGDFDGDGDLDQLLEYHETGAPSGVKLLLNTGGGDYVDGGWAVPQGTVIGGIGYGGSLVADLDQDGDQDLVAGTGNSSGSLLEFWFNDGTGQFTLGFTKVGRNPVLAADFDGNGLVDVLEGGVKIFFGTGGGTFDIEGDLEFTSSLPDGNLAVGDLDENGFLDIVAESGFDLSIWWNQGLGVFVQETITASPGRESGAVVGDVDGDGHLDIIANGYDSRLAHVLIGDGAGNFTPGGDLALYVATMQDMDDDGDLDALGSGMARNMSPATQGGARLQFGKSVAGTGGMQPKLGATGPFRVGEYVEIRLVGAQGGAFAAIFVSLSSVVQSDFPYPGFESYTAPAPYVRPLVLDGTPGVPGSGSARLGAVQPVSFQGLTFIMQGYVQDTSVVPWLTQTNGLLVHID